MDTPRPCATWAQASPTECTSTATRGCTRAWRKAMSISWRISRWRPSRISGASTRSDGVTSSSACSAWPLGMMQTASDRSEEHTSELQSPCNLVCRLLLEKKKTLVPVYEVVNNFFHTAALAALSYE